MAQRINPSYPPRRVPAPPRVRRLPDGMLISVLMLVLLVVAAVFVYRMSTRPASPEVPGDRSAVGRAAEQLPGGSDPQPKFGDTRAELKNRGGLGSADVVTRLSDITRDGRAESGRRVELKD